jgi:hypothetical protein
MIYGGNAVMGPQPRPLLRKTSALDMYYRNGISSDGLHGLGVAFADLPNGGHNLRLYTYDPIGSQFGPKNSCGSEPTNTWVYNTGHYDISLGTPCSQPDAQGFCDWTTMSAYAAQHGETLVLVTRAELSALCGYRAPAGTTMPQPSSTYTQPSGIPTGAAPKPITRPQPTSSGPGAITVQLPGSTTTTTTTASGGGVGPDGGGISPGSTVVGGAVEGGPPLWVIVLALLGVVMLSK